MLPFAFAACAPLSPVRAGVWIFTLSGASTKSATPSPGTYSGDPSASGAGSIPANVSLSTGMGGGPGQTLTANVKLQVPLHVAITWQPTGSLAADPQPSLIRITESGTTSASAGGTSYPGPNQVTGTSSSSFTSNPVPVTPVTTQYTVSGFKGLDHLFNGTGNVTVVDGPPPNGSGSASASTGFTYNVSETTAPVTGTIVVDQDQQVLPPAITTRLSATISNISGFAIDWVKISVDGKAATTATVTPGNPNNYFINWPQTGGNPSEHTVVATAQIHDSYGAIPLNSTDLPPRAFATAGQGRPADVIIADVRLQSLKFNSNLLLNQDLVTPVPTPEFTWTGGSSTPTASNPAAYIQGKNVNFTLLLGSSAGKALTGSATMGYELKMQANPNTTNPSTNQADPTLTLYDNTTGGPFLPTPCGASTTIAATTPLDSWVAPYTTSFPILSFYVEFTKLSPSPPAWAFVSTYGGSLGNTLYATVATPTAPMATPWVGVLNYACNWAARTSDATSATAMLVNAEYNNCTYNGGQAAFTDPFTDTHETFHLRSFLNNRTPVALYGQCDDFSDFLDCLSNALGADKLQSQRSASLVEIQNGSHFETNPITAPPDQNKADAAPRPGGWSYHQWTNMSGIYDGCLRFGGTTSVIGIAGPDFGSQYNIDLVASYLHPFTPPAIPASDWDWTAPLK